MPASRSVVSAVLQERFGHPDRAASVREHRCPPGTNRLAHPATDTRAVSAVVVPSQ